MMGIRFTYDMRLDGIRVLDLSRLLPGGYATQLLADMGAEVVKIERPGRGDYGREFDPKLPDGTGAVFAAVNRGKKSISIDLSTDDGVEILYRLVEDADVLFENFSPGVVDRLGIGYEDVRPYNSDLTYCSLTGYGQTGPKADRPGHDLNYAGTAGLLDMGRDSEEAPPTPPGFPLVDMAGGQFAAFGIVGGLLGQLLGNDGAENYVDVSMADVMYSFSTAVTVEALCGGDPRPDRTMLTGKYPCYDVYETKDERFVTFGALEPKFWTAFCDIVEREDLEEYHLSADPEIRSELGAELASIFGKRTRKEWQGTFDGTDVPFGVINTPAETLQEPQFQARDMVQTGTDGGVPHVGFPAAGPDGPAGTAVADWPTVGEHTDELLRGAGYSEPEREGLYDASVVYREDSPGER